VRPVAAHEPRVLRRAIARIALLCAAAAPMSGCCAWPFEDASDGYSTSRVVAMPFRVAHAGYRRDASLPPAVCKSVCGQEACFPSSVVGPSGVESAVVVCNDYSPRSCSDSGLINFRMPSGRRSAALAASAGTTFAALAEAESASIHDFDELAHDLEALGAPAALVARARRASADESRHAITMRRLARAHGATRTATEATEPGRARSPRRPSLARLAVENAVLGCVGETWGALLLAMGAMRAADHDVRRQLHRVACDEARHAALAFAIHAWVTPQLSIAERDEVDAALARATRKLIGERPGASVAVRRALGYPTVAEHAVIAPRLAALVRAGLAGIAGDGSARS